MSKNNVYFTVSFGSGIKFVLHALLILQFLFVVFAHFYDAVNNNHEGFIGFDLFYWQIKKTNKLCFSRGAIPKTFSHTIEETCWLSTTIIWWP